jgi:squalene-hopene/tetraprenyl-beta-curcumene cyclase
MLERLQSAYKTVRADLLAARERAGHWTGELSGSALSTATALSALAVYQMRAEPAGVLHEDDAARIRGLTLKGMHWLAEQQNADGGWGDTDQSKSNIATTMLVRAAFQLNGVPNWPPNLLEQADNYIQRNGGIEALRRRYGKDKTFAVPILANYALAGLVSWRSVAPLPFELACLPQSTYRSLRLPVVSYAIPALVAIGIARFHHAPPWNPIMLAVRKAAQRSALHVLQRMQPESGGFLEAVPLTSFVVMSLASAGHVRRRSVQRGVQFLIEAVRPDGTWPIDTNLATWVTTLGVNALAAGGEDLSKLRCADWILNCQHQRPHPYTGAEPGGWAWTDLSGGVPDADDTAGALLAMSAIARQQAAADRTIRAEVVRAAESGVDWLLDLQNEDGGWPTFCRGWGKLPFDRSGADLTAHALRAVHAWYVNFDQLRDYPALDRELRAMKVLQAIQRGLNFLNRQQRSDGSWVPLWFGNQYQKDEENPIYGTARVLQAYRDLGRTGSTAARRGFQWLLSAQDLGGGWGGNGSRVQTGEPHRPSSIEETSLAIEALLADPRLKTDERLQHMLDKGLAWLTEAVEQQQHLLPSPIGLYFARLWYYEKLYPLIFATSTLGHAVQVFSAAEGISPTVDYPLNMAPASNA